MILFIKLIFIFVNFFNIFQYNLHFHGLFSRSAVVYCFIKYGGIFFLIRNRIEHDSIHGMVFMQEAVLYLENVKKRLYSRLLSAFLVLILVTAVSGAAVFLLCGYGANGNFTVRSAEYGFREAVLGCAPMTAVFFFIFLSAYTTFNRTVLILSGVLRGSTMGCFLALTVGGRITGVGSGWTAGFVLSITETLVLLLYGAYSSVYSEPILAMRLSGNGVVSSSLSGEFRLCTLVFGGAAAVLGGISRWLIL